MKKLLVGIMLILTLGTQVQAKKVEQGCLWDQEVCGYKHGGKVVAITGIAAATASITFLAYKGWQSYKRLKANLNSLKASCSKLETNLKAASAEFDKAVDQLKTEIPKLCAQSLGISIEKFMAADEYIPYSGISFDAKLALLKAKSTLTGSEDLASSAVLKAMMIVMFNIAVAENKKDQKAVKKWTAELERLDKKLIRLEKN